ncbi:hypothetical protein FGO68_gene11909 [Halteria grandinella]|uniref:TLDc domain-containing protein n=1 Tax=Halteria grandinella TaxID=5974 RepID=A0A8J8ND98_HALGN|nr:hypothetical protein FGO68_gene11909 [Halteria grandinella]
MIEKCCQSLILSLQQQKRDMEKAEEKIVQLLGGMQEISASQAMDLFQKSYELSKTRLSKPEDLQKVFFLMNDWKNFLEDGESSLLKKNYIEMQTLYESFGRRMINMKRLTELSYEKGNLTKQQIDNHCKDQSNLFLLFRTQNHQTTFGVYISNPWIVALQPTSVNDPNCFVASFTHRATARPIAGGEIQFLPSSQYQNSIIKLGEGDLELNCGGQYSQQKFGKGFKIPPNVKETQFAGEQRLFTLYDIEIFKVTFLE